jgi:hypothetical protein
MGDSTPKMAHVLCHAKVYFLVNLETGQVETAELFANSLAHFDTGLDASPGGAEDWQQWQKKAQAIVARNGLSAPLLWNKEGA